MNGKKAKYLRRIATDNWPNVDMSIKLNRYIRMVKKQYLGLDVHKRAFQKPQ